MKFLKNKILSLQGGSWVYNLISLLNVACGLAVTGLIWYKYSASKESDILLLVTSSISILAQLSLVGVEQVLYFYADERKKGAQEAKYFFKLAFTWSLLSGAVFAALVVLLAEPFLRVVAPGLSHPSLVTAGFLLLCFSPQLILSPSLHVLKARWSLEEKFARAYLLSAVNPVLLLICLVITVVTGIDKLEIFGRLSLFVFGGFTIFFVFYNRKNLFWPQSKDWTQVKSLIAHSVAIKSGNSVHNFLVQALLNNLLSKMPVGSISIFQYAKKLADGVFAITAGPQVMIYHSKCAVAVSHSLFQDLKKNAAHFLKTFLSLFFAVATLIYFLAPLALSIVGKSFTPSIIDEIRLNYVGIVFWYVIIGIETLSVGIVLATRSSFSLLAVNFTFIFLFFLWSQAHEFSSILELTLTTAGFQLVSFCLFTISAWLIMRQRRML